MPATTGKFIKPWRAAFSKNLIQIINKVGGPEIKQLYLNVYDELAAREESEAGSAIKGRDPMSLVSLRDVFEKQLDRELASVEFKGDQLKISLMNKDFLGYSGSTPAGSVETVDVLAFYLEGIPDEHAFITTEQYKAGRKGANRGNFAGRLGGGFMMSRKDYEKEGWEKITGLSFAKVRHPISAQKRFSGFDNLASKVNMRKYIKLALAQTNRQFGT